MILLIILHNNTTMNTTMNTSMNTTNNLTIITIDNQQWIRVEDLLKKTSYNQNFEKINNLLEKNIAKESADILLYNDPRGNNKVYIKKEKIRKWLKNNLIYNSIINLILILF